MAMSQSFPPAIRRFQARTCAECSALRSSDFSIACDGSSFTFTVNGYGHGVGLSQYGADYMARQGATFDEILTHYYKGAQLAIIKGQSDA